jgi:Ala-tRNA(Pro) deacylase
MAIPKKVLAHLEANDVKFDIVEHKKVFTAYDLAQTLGHKLEKIGKTLLVKVDVPEVKKKGKNYFVVVLPASYRVDLKKIEKFLKAKKAEIVNEKMFKKLGIKPGALVPFGSLHKFEVMLDKSLLKAKDVLFNAGSYTESLRMKVKDLHKLENAVVAAIGMKGKKIKAQKKPAKKPAHKKGKKKSIRRR